MSPTPPCPWWGWRHDERESVERCVDAGGGGDQPERVQPSADRAEEHRCPTGRLRDGRRAGTLEGEMLGGHEGDCRWGRFGRGRCGAGLAMFHDVSPRLLGWVGGAI